MGDDVLIISIMMSVLFRG